MRHNLMDVLKIDKARGMSHLPQQKQIVRRQTLRRGRTNVPLAEILAVMLSPLTNRLK